jgi:sulfur dioxygenase
MSKRTEMTTSDSFVQLFDPASSTFTYILFDRASGEAAIVDAVDQHLERDLAAIAARHLKLKWIIETHAHADHITAAAVLASRTGARTAAPALCGITNASVQLNDGDQLPLGKNHIRAIHTPGHTAGSMCFLLDGVVLTGDTLLIGGCGRTDFQSGSAASLYDSITQRLFSLPDATVVLPGHDYQGRTSSTIGHEKTTNPRIAAKTKAQFVELMGELNLPPPKMIDTAVPANQRLGAAVPVIEPATGYAGDMPLALAHAWWQDRRGTLVDVRTKAEIDWVGYVPGALWIAWKHYPGMALNPDFDRALLEGVPKNQPVLFLCRSGIRSIGAARRATELGYTAYNILEGFEGDPDAAQQRGRKNGWRHAGYVWMQG